MPLSRRQFVHRTASAALLSALPSRMWAANRLASHTNPDAYASLADSGLMRTLALRAVDVARAAGAAYADVRLTRTVAQLFTFNGMAPQVADNEELAIGVRALVNGYWGFAASPYWGVDETVQLANDAVALAKVNAQGSARRVDMGTVPVSTGSWTMPGIDPFTVTIEEKIDCMSAWRQAVTDMPSRGLAAKLGNGWMNFHRQEKMYASTDGSCVAQTSYTSEGLLPALITRADWRSREHGPSVPLFARGLFAQGKGWEAFLDAKADEQMPALFAEAGELLAAPTKPIQLGRYDVVFDGEATASLLDGTIGVATELDRALGYEANGGGTSYLGPDPLALLGTTVVGSSLLTVTANRSVAGGVATTKWDDEGVTPADFTLVKNGTLVDYQTTREQAAWLAPWYQKQGIPVHSHGCAGASSALGMTMQMPPNLALAPGSAATSFNDLVAGTSKGIAIMGGGTQADFQAKNGYGYGAVVREIAQGKLGAQLFGAAFLFSSADVWKNLVALGGPDSVVATSVSRRKGQPGQETSHTVTAVPTKVKEIKIVDATRRA